MNEIHLLTQSCVEMEFKGLLYFKTGFKFKVSLTPHV